MRGCLINSILFLIIIILLMPVLAIGLSVVSVIGEQPHSGYVRK